MDLTPVIARLRTTLTGIKSIGGAAELEAAAAIAPAPPAAFVLPLAERASESGLTGTHWQEITQTFGVVLVVANRRDATGAASLTDLAGLRLQLRSALMGWVPAPAEGRPVCYLGGRLLRWDDGRLWWTDEWSVVTSYYA